MDGSSDYFADARVMERASIAIARPAVRTF